MSAHLLRRYSCWLLPLIGGALAALAGARMLTLSVRERSQQMRVRAQAGSPTTPMRWNKEHSAS